MEKVSRQAEWEELKEQYKSCSQCPLSSLRTNVVFGTGEIGARLLIIGEAPGADEDESGVPFVGQAGDKFNRILAAVGINRSDVWITNTCLCRPKLEGVPGKNNRAPLAGEIKACASRLRQEINIVRPQIIVLMGNTPLLAATGKRGITKHRGWQDIVWEGDNFEISKVFATLHPASLLYGSSEQILQKKQWVLSDWQSIAKAYREVTFGEKKRNSG